MIEYIFCTKNPFLSYLDIFLPWSSRIRCSSTVAVIRHGKKRYSLAHLHKVSQACERGQEKDVLKMSYFSLPSKDPLTGCELSRLLNSYVFLVLRQFCGII